MSETLVPVAARRPKRGSSIRVADVPALFSEGPEPEPARPAHNPWAAVEAVRLRLRSLVRRTTRRDEQ